MGTTYYVSATDGNNNHQGTKPEDALRTIQAAINKAQSGDTILVRAGSYSERLHIQKPGVENATLQISAYQSEKPVIEGTALDFTSQSGLVTILQSESVSINGFEIRNSRGRGVQIQKSSRVTITNCLIHSCKASGLEISQSEKIQVKQSEIHHCARSFLAGAPTLANAALALTYCKDVQIEDNKIHENSGQGISISTGCKQVIAKKNTCYDNRNGQINITSSVDITIEANFCYHSGRKEFLTIDKRRGPGISKSDIKAYKDDGKWHTRNLQIINNVVVGCGNGFENHWKSGKLTSLTLAHNTLVNSSEYAIKLDCDSPNRNTFIENNLIATADGGEMVRVKNVDGIIWRHNLWSSFPGNQVLNPASDIIESDVGLVNLKAKIEAGKLTAEPYKLLANSVAINKGIRRNGNVKVDFWGNKRNNLPDIGASEVPGSSVDEALDPALPPPGERVKSGIIAFYEFKEGQGTRVNDTSGTGDALNLNILNANAVSWTKNGLRINQPTLISSERPAKKIIDACRQSNEVTVEAWVEPLNVLQDGPARIVSISKDKVTRNVTMGQGLWGDQPANLYMTRLRTTWTSSNGLPPIVTPTGSATATLTHLVYTRTSTGKAVMYINGQERATGMITGQTTNWDVTLPLLLANELDGARAWLGEYRLVAIYQRALSNHEVLHNYTAGHPDTATVTAQFSIPEGAENGIIPHTVEFDSSESVAPTGIATYFWEFGDGQTSNRPNPTYTYTKSGVYTVSLTITNTKGISDKLTKSRLIRVAREPFPPMPEEYARFILTKVTDSEVVAFGVQYPDLRCTLLMNRDPFPLLVFQEVEDLIEKFSNENDIDIVWVDPQIF